MNEHFIELRKRVFYCLLTFCTLFGFSFSFAKPIYQYLAVPLLQQLPTVHLIAISITTPFFVQLKIGFLFALLLGMPFFLAQLWQFIAPGLYQQEKKLVLPLLLLSCFLFYIGIAFAFYIILPLALNFFVSCVPQQVNLMADMKNYLDFILTILLAAGGAFQIPILTHLAIRLNWISKEALRKKRPFVILLAFILGMVLTPPDVISQILLAIPMWLLFELGLICTKTVDFTKANMFR